MSHPTHSLPLSYPLCFRSRVHASSPLSLLLPVCSPIAYLPASSVISSLPASIISSSLLPCLFSSYPCSYACCNPSFPASVLPDDPPVNILSFLPVCYHPTLHVYLLIWLPTHLPTDLPVSILPYLSDCLPTHVPVSILPCLPTCLFPQYAREGVGGELALLTLNRPLTFLPLSLSLSLATL